MAGLQDLAVRLAEILDIPESEALRITARAQPVITIESIVGQPTTRVPGLVGAPSTGRNTNQPAAGQFGHVQLFNPADSGVIIHLDRAWPAIDVAGRCEIRRHDTALGNAGTGRYRDFRRRGLPAGRMNENTNAARQGSTIGEVTLTANESIPVELDLILPEATGVLFGPRDIDVDTRVFWLWREVQRAG